MTQIFTSVTVGVNRVCHLDYMFEKAGYAHLDIPGNGRGRSLLV